MRALHAEWPKVRTVLGTFWLLAAVIALTVTGSAAAVAATRCPAGLACPVGAVRLTLAGVELGQALIATPAVLVISSEYSTGMIRIALTAVPRRPVMLAAKATALTSLVLAGAAIAVTGSVLAGGSAWPRRGFIAARGFPPLSPA